MTSIISAVTDKWYQVLDKGDHRLDDYILVRTSLSPFLIIVSYGLIVLKIGPYLMKNREPFQLKTTLLIYNIVQILANFYMLKIAYKHYSKMSVFCEPIREINPETIDMARSFYFFYLLKIADLFDTIFFVLRKNQRQVSFLHVYHHMILVVALWIGCKWYPGGQVIFVGVVNAPVHMVMYAYYFLSAWDPKFKQNLILKRTITQIQIVQQIILIIIFGSSLFNPYCSYPKFPLFLLFTNFLIMTYLFCRFYNDNYIRKKNLKRN